MIFFSAALLAEIKEISKKQHEEDNVLLTIATGARRPVIPNMEFQLPDSDIHVYVYWLIKNSCQYMCSAERSDQVLKVYTTLLEPMLGVSSHLQHTENTEGDFVKAGVVVNGVAPCTGESDGSPIGVAATTNIRRSDVANSPQEPSSSSARSVSNDDRVDEDNFHDPDHISDNSDTIYEKHNLKKVENNVTSMDEMSITRKIEQPYYSSISAAEVEDNYERVHEEPGSLKPMFNSRHSSYVIQLNFILKTFFIFTFQGS